MSTWNCHVNLNELVLEQESATPGIDQSLTGPGALELESEWGGLESEVDHIESILVLASLLGN